MPKALNPCPFCGGVAELYQPDVSVGWNERAISSEIRCVGTGRKRSYEHDGCGASLSRYAANLHEPDDEAAIAAWNRRA